MKLRTVMTTAAACAMLALTAPASAQPAKTDKDKERAPLQTTLKDDAVKNREQLVQNINRLVLQLQAADEVLAELRKADDGTSEARARMVVINLIKERDRVALMNPVTSSVEHLRYSLEKERAGCEALKARREADAGLTQQRIDALADQAVGQEEFLARTDLDPEKRAEAERTRASLQKQMMAQIALRDERLAGARDYERAIDRIARERKALKSVDEWIDHEAKMAAVRVERLNDVVQHSAQEDRRRDSEELKKTVHTAVELLRKIQDTPPPPTTPVPPRADEVKPPNILPAVKPDAPTVTPAQVEEALKAARDRRKAQAAPRSGP